MVESPIDKTLFPYTSGLLRDRSANHYRLLANSELPRWSDAFRAAFEENLSLTITDDLFKGDRNFRADLAGENVPNFLARISELWLAAHLVRGGFQPKRVKQKQGENTPEFQITVGTESTARVVNVEVKRIVQYDNGDPNDIVRCMSAPTHLHQTDFINQVSERLSDEKGITAKQLGWGEAKGVFALDVAACHDFQLNLYSDSDEAAIAWLRAEVGDEARRRNAESIFCFASSLSRLDLHAFRWFRLSE